MLIIHLMRHKWDSKMPFPDGEFDIILGCACCYYCDEGEEMKEFLQDLQYPHWMIIAGTILVALGVIGFAFRQNKNVEPPDGLKAEV